MIPFVPLLINMESKPFQSPIPIRTLQVVQELGLLLQESSLEQHQDLEWSRTSDQDYRKPMLILIICLKTAQEARGKLLQVGLQLLWLYSMEQHGYQRKICIPIWWELNIEIDLTRQNPSIKCNWDILSTNSLRRS